MFLVTTVFSFSNLPLKCLKRRRKGKRGIEGMRKRLRNYEIITLYMIKTMRSGWWVMSLSAVTAMLTLVLGLHGCHC
jgi:hypothetical protein